MGDEIWTCNYFHPCHLFDASAICFMYFFSRSADNKVTDLPFIYAAQNSQERITHVCSSSEIPNTKILGCIWGLSANIFPLFNLCIASAGLERQRTSCLLAGKLSSVASRRAMIYCPLVFKTEIQRLGSNSSLIEWCSLFVNHKAQLNMTDRDWQWWFACLEGASAMHTFP